MFDIIFPVGQFKASDILFYGWYTALAGLKTYGLLNLPFSLLFNVFLIIPWFTFKTAPRLLKYSVILVPVVFAVNLLYAFATDSRLWLSLIPVLIPLGLLGLSPDQAPSCPPEPSAPNN